jgi:hypothetical protein
VMWQLTRTWMVLKGGGGATMWLTRILEGRRWRRGEGTCASRRREAGPGSGKFFACAQDWKIYEPSALAIAGE